MTKQFRGGYLAPEIEVMEMNSQEMLCASPVVTVDGNPFGSNDEEDW